MRVQIHLPVLLFLASQPFGHLDCAGSGKAVIAGPCCRQVSQPSLSFHFLALARLLIRSCYAGIVLFLHLSLACEGSNSICFSDTSAGSLGTSLRFSGRERGNPVTLSAESRAHLPMPAWLPYSWSSERRLQFISPGA